MGREYIDCRVRPNANVPAGMAPVRLEVLSPCWRGEGLIIRFPQGDEYFLTGWATAGGGAECGLTIFWTRPEECGPAVCMALGGDGGVKMAPWEIATGPDWSRAAGYPLLALAESVIPPEVRKVVGPAPEVAAPPLLLPA